MNFINLVSFAKRFQLFRVFSKKFNSEREVRVRFAPSPTGYLHLGGLRTALYNYLFAKSKNGKFILRIEDTDQSRAVKGASEKIIADLDRCGIQIDEGPFIGGLYGPYIQSERLILYKKEVNKLIENGNAYYCFCTDKRLDFLRKDAIRNRQIAKYDNKCRYLTSSQIAEKLSNSNQFCIRFKLKKTLVPFKDIIYGDILYNVIENEGDPILIKSDGYPTYHLANIVDDHHMKISHVFRGVEWQISTNKHLLLYKAFGWEPPKFGHLPLLVNSNGSKLSKRQDDTQISQYSKNGIFPMALINYLSATGGGFQREQGIGPCSYTMDVLTKQFDYTKINSHPSKLNPQLLKVYNRLEIIRLMQNKKTRTQLIYKVREIILRKYPNKKNNVDVEENHIEKVLNWCCSRISNLEDLARDEFAFFWIISENCKDIDISNEKLRELVSRLESTSFKKQNIYDILKKFSKEYNIEFPKLMTSLRSILTGFSNGPGVAEMMEMLGKQTTLKRLSSLLK